jgi:hypothetical protein
MAIDPNTTQNSFSTILANFIRLQNNSLETLQKIQQATTSNADTLTINVQNNDGTTNTYTIPSFGYLKGSIERIDQTITKMLGFDGTEAFIRMPDGTFKRIYQSITLKNPQPVGQLPVPSKFLTENNWFFENLYSPALKVSFNVTPFIPQQESKIFVKRMLLNLDTRDKLAYFDESLKGKNNLDYIQLLVELQKRNITYFLDEGVIDLPLSVIRYRGDFLVVNYEDREVTNPDGSVAKKRWYLFDKLTYSDSLELSIDTLILKVGDRLIKAETTYEITEIDISTKYVRVKRLNGYDPFVVGETTSLYSETFSPKLANVGIGFNEYDVIFFRTINDEDNLISTTYSPGIAFYTNDLVTDTTDGSLSMQDFYQKYVLDFGNILLTQAKEGKISAVDGLSPDAPVLDNANFKVVLINDHKLDQAEIDAVRKKQADKITLESEITELEKSIDKKKEELNSRKFNSETERRGVKNELDSLVREKSSKSTLYASIVKELNVIAQQKPAALDSPKYRIRGFFSIPNPKQSIKTGLQNVIQFYTYYRYIRPDGSKSNVKQFDFTDQNGQIKRGTYSNLTEIKSEIRKKVYDVGTGKYIWAGEDIENPDAVNINQVDIPISKGEKVEFYVISVSEAGWPENPLLSSSSNVITIEFPNDLASEDEASIALSEAVNENIRVQLDSDLAAKGLDIHLSSSFNAIEKYYAHDADVISSNFYTPEGNVISLYEKMKEMQGRIQELEDRLNRVAGILSVYIIDPDNNTKTPIKDASVIQLFAGYYLDYATLLPINQRRGAIVSKTYQIAIQNNEATPLQLVSRFPGGLGSSLPTTLTSAQQTAYYPAPINTTNSPYQFTTLFPTTSDPDYNSFRLYDQTPITQPSIGSSDTNNANKYATAFYQSGQSTGQFIFSRYKDVGLVNNLYQEVTPLSRYLAPTTPLAGPTSWIWSGGVLAPPAPPATQIFTPIGNGTLSEFCIHTDHPLLTSTTNYTLTSLQLPTVTIDSATGLPTSSEAISAFRHAYGVNDQVTTVNGFSPQLNYRQNLLRNAKVGTTYPASYPVTDFNELPEKFGFVDNDRFLVGRKTCGSYLFLAPSTFNQLNVNGIDARSTKTISAGDDNAIIIPVIFQFRMEDYHGTPGGAGAGIIGGWFNGTAPTNLTYGRRIGIDIYSQDEPAFSFDIQVSAVYKKTSLSQVVATATPTVNKQLQNIVYTKDTIKTLKS